MHVGKTSNFIMNLETLEYLKMTGLQKTKSNSFVTHDGVCQFNNTSSTIYGCSKYERLCFQNFIMNKLDNISMI